MAVVTAYVGLYKDFYYSFGAPGAVTNGPVRVNVTNVLEFLTFGVVAMFEKTVSSTWRCALNCYVQTAHVYNDAHSQRAHNAIWLGSGLPT